MNRHQRSHSLLLCTLLSLSCFALPAKAIDGSAAFSRHCAACHMRDGAGAPTLAPPLRTALWKKLGSSAPDYLVQTMLSGMVGEELDGESYFATMPEWNTLSDGEIAAIAGFILINLNGLDTTIEAERVSALRKKKPHSDELMKLRDGAP